MDFNAWMTLFFAAIFLYLILSHGDVAIRGLQTGAGFAFAETKALQGR